MKKAIIFLLFFTQSLLSQSQAFKSGKFDGFAIVRYYKYNDCDYRPDYIFLQANNIKDTSFHFTTIWTGLCSSTDISKYGIETFFDTSININVPKLSKAKILPKRMIKKLANSIRSIKTEYYPTQLFRYEIFYAEAKFIYKKVLIDKEKFEEELSLGNYISRENIVDTEGERNTICNYSFLYKFQRLFKVN